MSDVTVLGTHGSIVHIPIDTSTNAVLAQQLLDVVTKGIELGDVTPYQLGETAPTIGYGELIISGNGGTAMPPPSTAIIVDNATLPSVIFGGSAPVQLLVSGESGINYIVNTGAGTVIAGGGSNYIFAGAGTGDHLYQTGNGDDTIIAETGNSTIQAGFGQNIIQLGSGNSIVDVTGTDDITAGSGFDTVTVQNGGSAVISGGSGTVFLANTGLATLFGGEGSTTVMGSGGGYYEGGKAGHNLLIGVSTLGTTLHGGGNGDTLQAGGGGDDLVVAGDGNETLLGTGGGKVTFVTGSGNDYVKAGSGADTIFDGSGNATLWGGAGPDTFVFKFGTAGGHTEIKDFTVGTDSVVLDSYPGHTITEILNAGVASTVNGGSFTITLSKDVTVTFDGLTSLDKSSFIKGS
jgi:hypothetical protein